MPGAMLSLNTELERVLKQHISKFASDAKKNQVKFPDNGARVSRVSNFVIFFNSSVIK